MSRVARCCGECFRGPIRVGLAEDCMNLYLMNAGRDGEVV